MSIKVMNKSGYHKIKKNKDVLLFKEHPYSTSILRKDCFILYHHLKLCIGLSLLEVVAAYHLLDSIWLVASFVEH